MVTCASRKEAGKISARLLKKRLVACIGILPGIKSEYWWEGKLNCAAEIMVTMKTISSNFKKIEAEIKRLHSYKVPEIIALPIVMGSRDYLDWISRTAV